MRSKFFILFLTFVLVSPSLFSQKKHRYGTGTKIDIIAGVDLQNFYGSDFWGEALKNRFQPGFHAGADINIPLIPDFYLQAGLLIHNKGSRQDTVAGSIKTASLYYAEIPVNFLFRPQLGDGHIMIGFGPFLAYGFYGSENIKTGGKSDRLRVRFLNNASDQPTKYAYYRPLDAGAAIQIGYELYSNVFFQAGAQMGLLKINPGYGLANDKSSRKNIGFGFSAGYRF